jgi:hypothetical protein
MENCKILYLDKDLKKSATYYGNGGSAAAKSKYLQEMYSHAVAKFQRNGGTVSINQIRKDSQAVFHKMRDPKYDHFTSGSKVYKSDSIKTWDEKQQKSTSKLKAINDLDNDLKERGYQNFLYSKLVAHFGSAKELSTVRASDKETFLDVKNELVERYFSDFDKSQDKKDGSIEYIPKEINQGLKVETINEINNFVKEGEKIMASGTTFHESLEFFFEYLQLLKENGLTNTEQLGDNSSDFFQLFNFKDGSDVVKKVAQSQKGSMLLKSLSQYMKIPTESEPLIDYTSSIRAIFAEINKTIGGNFSSISELALFDDVLEMKGIIDLVIIKDNGKAVFVDFKSVLDKHDQDKYNSSPEAFGKAYGNIDSESFEDIGNSKQARASLQLSFYKVLFEHKYGIEVEDIIIPIFSGMTIRDGGEYDHYYQKVNLSSVVKGTDYSERMREHIYKKTGVQIRDFNLKSKRIEEPSKINSSSDLVEFFAQADFNGYKDIDRQVNNVVITQVLKDVNGKTYYRDNISNKEVYFKTVPMSSKFRNEDERRNAEIKIQKEQYKEYLREERKHLGALTTKFISSFDSNSVESLPKAERAQAKRLLHGIDPSTHDIIRVNELNGYEHIDGNVVLVKNKIDNSGEIIVLDIKSPSRVEIKEGKAANQHLFGEYISKSGLKKYRVEPIENNQRQFKLLNANLLLLELVNDGHIKTSLGAKAGLFRNSRINEKIGTMSSDSFANLLPLIKDLVEKEGKKFNQFTKDSYFDAKFIEKATKYSSVKKALHYVKSDLFFESLDLNRKNALKDVLKNIEDVDPKTRHINQIKKLEEAAEYIGGLAKFMKDSSGSSTIEDEPDYILLNQLYLEIKNIREKIGRTEEETFDNKFRTAGRISDAPLKTFSEIQAASQARSNQQFKEFSNENGKATRKFMQDSGSGKGRFSMSSLNDSYASLFKVNPQDIDWSQDQPVEPSKVKDLYTLKDENNPNLESWQRDYIKFFNDKVDEYIKQFLDPPSLEKFNNPKTRDEIWPRGRVPLVFASTTSDIWSSKTIEEKFKKMRDSVKDIRSNRKSVDEFEMTAMSIENEFAKQLRGAVQNTSRLDMMGIDAAGNITKGKKIPLEIDLSLILNNFVASTIFSNESQEVSYAYNAIQNALHVNSELFNHNNDKISSELEKMFLMLTKNNYKNNDKYAPALDSGNKFLSLYSLGLSMKQFVLETSTNLFQTVSMLIAQHSKGKDRRLGTDNWFYAGQMIGSRLGNNFEDKYRNEKGAIAELLIQYFGVYDSDPNLFKSFEFSESKKRFMFRSKWMYSFNNIPFKFFKAQMFIAELHKKGLLDTLSIKDGNIHYDYTKDHRFKGIFDSKGEVIKNLRSEELKKKAALYEFYLAEGFKEGTLTEDGKLKMPITLKEGNDMKDFSTSLFGSMDKDAQVLLSWDSWGRLIGKFRNWMSRKKDNYWTKGHYSSVRGKVQFIKDSSHPQGGYYEWESEWVEGVIQTFVQVAQGMKNEEGNWISRFKKVKGNMSDMQRDNMNKFFSDISLYYLLNSVLFAGLSEMLDDDDEFSKLMLKAATNGATDLSPFSLADSVMSGSPIVTFSFFQSLISNLFNAIYSTVTLDEDMSEAWGDLFGKSGAIKSTNAMIDQLST